MSASIVTASYISSTSARRAPNDSDASPLNRQKYSEPEVVTFKVAGHSRFKVELTKRTRERIQAAGGIKGVKGKRGLVTFDRDCSGAAIPVFTLPLRRSTTPPPPRKPSYPKALEAMFLFARFHSYPSGYMARYQGFFEVEAHGCFWRFSRTMTGKTADDIRWNKSRIYGSLDANGVATFKLAGQTFERELWDH